MAASMKFKSFAPDFFTQLPRSARTPPHEFHFEGVFEGLKRMKHHETSPVSRASQVDCF